MSRVTPQEVERLARLSRIGLSLEEISHLAFELDTIVQFVEQLKAVDVNDVIPTDQVTGLTGVMRADEVVPGLSHTEIFLNVPSHMQGYIKVKRVLGG